MYCVHVIFFSHSDDVFLCSFWSFVAFSGLLFLARFSTGGRLSLNQLLWSKVCQCTRMKKTNDKAPTSQCKACDRHHHQPGKFHSPSLNKSLSITHRTEFLCHSISIKIKMFATSTSWQEACTWLTIQKHRLIRYSKDIFSFQWGVQTQKVKQ